MARRGWKTIRVAVAALFVLCVFLYIVDPRITGDAGARYARAPVWQPRHPSTSLLNSLGLDEDQCHAAFPGLTRDINRTVELGPFALKQARNFGPLQARLKDGQVRSPRLLSMRRPPHRSRDEMQPDTRAAVHHPQRGQRRTHSRDVGGDNRPSLLPLSGHLGDHAQSRTAALHQLHRAIITSPTPLPDTILAVNVQDEAFSHSWSYSRPAYTAPTPGSPPVSHTFLMPHFAFWAWPLPFIGSFARAAAAVDALEARLPFARKDPRVVWRGTKRYNSAHHPRMREDLLRATAGRAWADVQELKWAGAGAGGGGGGDGAAGRRRPKGAGAGAKAEPVAANALLIEDFCRYKYVVHTEGITYSGRFQLHQLCGSVLLTPPVAWLQHTTHLIRPLFSSHLDLGGTSERGGAGKGGWKPSEGEKKAWPTHYPPQDANIVFVAPDWSDLEATVQWLEAHPDVAEGIARRQRELFAGGGYFSPAAEACYWRALIRGWSKVARIEGEGWEGQEGITYESFVMLRDR